MDADSRPQFSGFTEVSFSPEILIEVVWKKHNRGYLSLGEMTCWCCYISAVHPSRRPSVRTYLLENLQANSSIPCECVHICHCAPNINKPKHL